MAYLMLLLKSFGCLSQIWFEACDSTWCPFRVVNELELPFLNDRLLAQHEKELLQIELFKQLSKCLDLQMKKPKGMLHQFLSTRALASLFSSIETNKHMAYIAKGVVVDVSHVNGCVEVAKYMGEEQLGKTLDGVAVVIIPTGVLQKPGMTRDDLFNINAARCPP
eukprot:Gb_34912 [translate_table: standard]